jgi:putative membrane protein
MGGTHPARSLRRGPAMSDEADAGTDPDYRFTLANERTYLAWQRTALGLVAGGVGLAEFAQSALPSPLTSIVAVLAVLLGGTAALLGLVRWRSADAAMRHGRPLPRPRAIPMLAIGLSVIAVVIAIGMVLT